ncbi:MAG: hypothetical protein NZ888_05845 [Candidatus Nitrosocaldus sp.]|nr:hypothetical protein [Candidatus Nitrosocaldus sp.]MDW8000708.1 hypothetical protein [Candidatus Nitrosocaldus sp.]
MQQNELKKVLLEMLDKDTEFRHAVAGLIGYKEILDRITKLEERVVKVEEEIRNLRRDMLEGFRRHDEEFRLIRREIREIRVYMERSSLTLEEEAREVVQYRLRERGLTALSISRLELPDLEVDIYGIDTDTCVVGEVKTRASPSTIEEVDKDIEALCARYPQYVRKKVIKVVYAMQVANEAVREAERRGIWVVTASRDLTPLVV